MRSMDKCELSTNYALNESSLKTSINQDAKLTFKEKYNTKQITEEL